jgi:hypothetical protein
MQGAKTLFVNNAPAAVRDLQDQLGSAISATNEVKQYRM